MSTPKSSVYCYLFNVVKYSFAYREALENFAAFADEVVCATIPCEDDSPQLLKELESVIPGLRVIETDISLKNNRFDGQLKTAALRATTHPIKVIMDGDERFVLAQKPLWEVHYEWLLEQKGIDGFYVPVIDLWGSPTQIRADADIGQKFRVHKATIVARGVMPEAETFNGHYDTKLSDSTEPLTANGTLGLFASFTTRSNLYPMFSRTLLGLPYVVHHGYLSLEARAKINGEFWKQKWEDRSGKTENVETDVAKLAAIRTIDHGLPIS